MDITITEITIPLRSDEFLSLKRFTIHKSGPPVFLLHGVIENGRIFYRKSGQGLAPYLARQGYDVFVADLRGHGNSKPAINHHADYGQTGTIIEEIPAFIEKIIEIKGEQLQYWVAHSWGGVLMSACLARFPQYRKYVCAGVYFASKRRVRVWNIHRLIKISLIWNTLCRIICKRVGYLPAKSLKMGSDNETANFHLGCKLWIKQSSWRDTEDGFDYGQAICSARLPPILYLAAVNDTCLGHPKDVERFMQESGQSNTQYMLLGKAHGNQHDYDHVNILTHPDAQSDHFPQVLAWLKQQH